MEHSVEREGALASSQPLPYTNFGCLSQTQAHNAKIRKRSTVLTLAVTLELGTHDVRSHGLAEAWSFKILMKWGVTYALIPG